MVDAITFNKKLSWVDVGDDNNVPAGAHVVMAADLLRYENFAGTAAGLLNAQALFNSDVTTAINNIGNATGAANIDTVVAGRIAVPDSKIRLALDPIYMEDAARGRALGVASLDSASLVPKAQLPELSLEGTFAQRPTPAAAGRGFVYFAKDTGEAYRSTGTAWSLVLRGTGTQVSVLRTVDTSVVATETILHEVATLTFLPGHLYSIRMKSNVSSDQPDQAVQMRTHLLEPGTTGVGTDATREFIDDAAYWTHTTRANVGMFVEWNTTYQLPVAATAAVTKRLIITAQRAVGSGVTTFSGSDTRGRILVVEDRGFIRKV